MSTKWTMGLALLMILSFLSLAACKRGDEPAPAPGDEVASPAAAAKLDLEIDDEEEEEDIFAVPLGTDFEIDGNASRYYGWTPMTVVFTARALNGKPPFTFTWDLGDGSPPAAGETVTHTYTKLGMVNASVTGQDANGDKSTVQFMISVVTPEQYSRRKNVPLEQLLASPAPQTSPQGAGQARENPAAAEP